MRKGLKFEQNVDNIPKVAFHSFDRLTCEIRYTVSRCIISYTVQRCRCLSIVSNIDGSMTAILAERRDGKFKIFGNTQLLGTISKPLCFAIDKKKCISEYDDCKPIIQATCFVSAFFPCTYCFFNRTLYSLSLNLETESTNQEFNHRLLLRCISYIDCDTVHNSVCVSKFRKGPYCR